MTRIMVIPQTLVCIQRIGSGFWNCNPKLWGLNLNVRRCPVIKVPARKIACKMHEIYRCTVLQTKFATLSNFHESSVIELDLPRDIYNLQMAMWHSHSITSVASNL